MDRDVPSPEVRPSFVRRDSVAFALKKVEYEESKKLPKSTVTTLSKVKLGLDSNVNLIRSLIGGDDASEEEEEFEPVEFSSKIPEGSEESLKRLWPVARNGLSDVGIDGTLNIPHNIMTVKSRPDLRKDRDMFKARDLLKLLARGMEFNLAILILKDGYMCDFIKIGGTVGSKEEFEKRRGRLIGPDGMTIKAIELLTKTYILVTGSTVCVLGRGYTGLNIVGEIVLDCMNKLHPISHIRRLVIMKELESDEKILRKDWVRFMPPVKKNGESENADNGHRTWGKIDFLNDEPSETTYSRQFALSLMEFEWYYPRIESEETEKKELPKIIEYEGKNPSPTKGDFKENLNYENEASTDKEESSGSSQAHFNSNLSVSNENEPLPKLEEAWAFFEHNVLARHYVDFSIKKPKNFIEGIINYRNQDFKWAPPGANTSKTRLYSFFLTPLNQMGDFGIGIGLYFTTLRSLTILMFIVGVIQIPNMNFYATKYSPSKTPGVATIWEDISALCEDHHWKPCPDCDRGIFGKHKNLERYGNLTLLDGETIHFAIKNDCDRSDIFTIGMLNWFSIIVLYVGVAYLNRQLEKMEVEFDEDEQTAQDYSLIVENPPKDAIDPEDWKEFFEELTGGHVTVCTIGVDNDLLLQTLVNRRLTIDYIKATLPPRTTLHSNDLAKVAANTLTNRKLMYRIFVTWLHPFGIALDLSAHFNNFVQLTSKIRGLCQIEYPVTKVYITFETEKAQRIALSKLAIGRFEDKKKIKPSNMFRGKVLFLGEPEEPSTIRWEDLNAKLRKRIISSIFTAIVMFVAIVLSFMLVVKLQDWKGVNVAALGISTLNIAIPLVTKILVKVESHPNESSKQASMYWKITLFRWINTAVIITFSMPFTSTTMEGDQHLLSAIRKIFVADILTVTSIQFIDPMGFINKHIRGPRASTQLEMNKLFKGTSYELAERYTQTTKTVFLTFFYATIYPGGFFLASIALFANYFLDAFSLMRTWAPAPKLGNSISHLSRRYFFPIALLFLSIISSYYWSGFPFDNLCLVHNMTVPEKYLGDHVIFSQLEHDSNVKPHNVTVDINENVYRHCSQDFMRDLHRFPFAPSFQKPGGRWMTSDQEKVAWLHAITSAVLLASVFFFFLYDIYINVMGLFKLDYEPQGKDMKINFSDIKFSVTAYIPQVLNTAFLFPLVACDTQDFDESLFDWKDSEKDYIEHSLLEDARTIVGPGPDLTKVFSRVKHWKPAKYNKNPDD